MSYVTLYYIEKVPKNFVRDISSHDYGFSNWDVKYNRQSIYHTFYLLYFPRYTQKSPEISWAMQFSLYLF